MRHKMKFLVLGCIVLILSLGTFFFMERRERERIDELSRMHPSMMETRLGGEVLNYFSSPKAPPNALQTLVKKRFDGDVINNIHKVRFDAPGTAEFEIDPHLQYFQPYPIGGGMPYKGFSEKVVYPESEVIYTFGNKSLRSKKRVKFDERYDVFEEDYPNQDVLAVVTHMRPEACFKPKGGLKVQPVNILPWPQRIKNEEDIIVGKHAGCMIHPEGWLYFASFVYIADAQDVLNSRKGNKK